MSGGETERLWTSAGATHCLVSTFYSRSQDVDFAQVVTVLVFSEPIVAVSYLADCEAGAKHGKVHGNVTGHGCYWPHERCRKHTCARPCTHMHIIQDFAGIVCARAASSPRVLALLLLGLCGSEGGICPPTAASYR